MKRSIFPIVAIVTLSAGMLFSATDFASAQKKKLTYEQAYEACRTGDMKGTGSASGSHAGGNYARGAACMKKYGYRLKK